MGWILGTYEAGAPARFEDGVPDCVRQRASLEGDLERLLPNVEGAQRVARSPPAASREHRERADAYTPAAVP